MPVKQTLLVLQVKKTLNMSWMSSLGPSVLQIVPLLTLLRQSQVLLDFFHIDK